MKSETNDSILTQTIFEIAKIFEVQNVDVENNLPISGFYPNNPFFSSTGGDIQEGCSAPTVDLLPIVTIVV